VADKTNNLNSQKKINRLQWGIGISIFLAAVFVILGFLAWYHGYQSLEKGGNHLNDLGNFGS